MDLVLPGLDHAETILDFMFVCFSFNTIYIYWHPIRSSFRGPSVEG